MVTCLSPVFGSGPGGRRHSRWICRPGGIVAGSQAGEDPGGDYDAVHQGPSTMDDTNAELHRQLGDLEILRGVKALVRRLGGGEDPWLCGPAFAGCAFVAVWALR